jgi:FkbM family methyltransferase
MRANTYDIQAVHEVWRLKAYEDEYFTIGAGDVVIDIGAHIGAFSVWAATQAISGQIYAFEPNDENYLLSEENKTLNDLKNLHIFNLAVSNKSGEAVLFNSEYHNMTHSFFEDGTQSKEIVRTISLGEILQENRIDRVNYLKIDAEGAEYLIVLNAPSKVLGKIDKIFIEYHDNLDHGHNFKELVRYLIGNGFQVEIAGSAFSRHILNLGLLKARRIAQSNV